MRFDRHTPDEVYSTLSDHFSGSINRRDHFAGLCIQRNPAANHLNLAGRCRQAEPAQPGKAVI